MQHYQRSDGRYVAATYKESTRRFRTDLTKNRLPNEAMKVDELIYARSYCSIASLARAIRKKKKGQL